MSKDAARLQKRPFGWRGGDTEKGKPLQDPRARWKLLWCVLVSSVTLGPLFHVKQPFRTASAIFRDRMGAWVLSATSRTRASGVMPVCRDQQKRGAG